MYKVLKAFLDLLINHFFNHYFFNNFFVTYIKMSKDLSAKYYQDNEKTLQEKGHERFQNLSKEEKDGYERHKNLSENEKQAGWVYKGILQNIEKQTCFTNKDWLMFSIIKNNSNIQRSSGVKHFKCFLCNRGNFVWKVVFPVIMRNNPCLENLVGLSVFYIRHAQFFCLKN